VPRWTDLRLANADFDVGIRALLETFRPLTIQVDPRPPAAGPEVEISLQDVPEASACAVLEEAGVTVLACRTRLDLGVAEAAR
jgi:hypothetical protein